MQARFAIVAALSLSLTVHAQSAEAELERQLKEMVGKPPTKLLIEYEGLDQPNYKLVEIAFDLDGSSLQTPALLKLDSEGKHLIFHGDVKPGKHTLETTVVLTDVSGVLFSYEAGFKWKVKKNISFEQQPGLEVQILVVPDMNPSEKDAKKKFTIKSNTAVKMLAKLEDGTMPDSPKANIAKVTEDVDAGTTTVAELSPAEKAKVLKAAAAEEARRKKEEAIAAKAAAAEEKKRKKEEAAAAKAASAEDKKRKKEEAIAAKKAAEEEKRRKKEEALAAAKNPKANDTGNTAANTGTGNTGGTPATGTGGGSPDVVAATDTVDAGVAVAQVEPAPVKANPPTKAADVTAPAESGGGLGLPLPVLVGIGVALLGIVIFFATRKKEKPPY